MKLLSYMENMERMLSELKEINDIEKQKEYLNDIVEFSKDELGRLSNPRSNIIEMSLELSEKLGYKIDGKVEATDKEVSFWIPWNHTGAWSSLEDAKKDCLSMNEKDEVLWAWSDDDIKELLEVNNEQ